MVGCAWCHGRRRTQAPAESSDDRGGCLRAVDHRRRRRRRTRAQAESPGDDTRRPRVTATSMEDVIWDRGLGFEEGKLDGVDVAGLRATLGRGDVVDAERVSRRR
jgi:hypothetical protein